MLNDISHPSEGPHAASEDGGLAGPPKRNTARFLGRRKHDPIAPTTLVCMSAIMTCAGLFGCGSEQDKDRKLNKPVKPASNPIPGTVKDGEADAQSRRKPVKVGLPQGSSGTGQAPGCVAPLRVELALNPNADGDPVPHLTGQLDAVCFERGQAQLRLALTSEVRLSAALSCSRLQDSVFNFACTLDGAQFRNGDTIAIPIQINTQTSTNLRAEIEFPDPDKTPVSP